MTNYIYLLQEKEFIITNKNIYKIGKIKEENLKKIKSYLKDSILIFQIITNNSEILEELKIDFNSKYIQKIEYGTEYFEGNYKNMIEDIYNKISLFDKNNKIEKIIDIEELNILIDKSIKNNQILDIAKIVYIMYKDKENIKVQNNKWYIYDIENDEWKFSYKGTIIRNFISTDIYNIYVERSTYYNKKILNDDHDFINIKLYEFMAKKSFNIALKLKNTTFKNNIMKNLYSIFLENS